VTRAGFEVTTAGDAASAVRAVGEQDFTLVTVDLSLPGAEGLALVEALQWASEAHLLLVTGRVLSPDQRAEAVEAGADDVLIKPFPLTQLRARAERVAAAATPAAS
jgi:two-component system response regulator TctD